MTPSVALWSLGPTLPHMMERVWRRLGSGGGGETCPNCLGDVTWTDRGHLRRCEICGQIAETAAAN